MKKWAELNPLQTIVPLIKGSKATDLLQPYTPRLQPLHSYDGVNIPITVVGKPDAKPVLLLHAFGMDARQFLPFVLPLASKYCFYLPHFRGFGLAAETPTSEFDFIEQYANDLDQILSHICAKHHVPSVDVAAISMGALVVWAYLSRFTDSANTSKTDTAKSDTSTPEALKTDNSTTDTPKTITHKIASYLNIDQSPIVKNQPDWRGGVFGEKQAEVFDQFQTVLDTTLPYLTDQQLTEFDQLPFKVRQDIVELETAFSLMSVQRLPSRLLVNGVGYMPDRRLATYQHPTWQQKLKGLQAYLQLPYDYRQALSSTQIPVTMLVGGQSQLYDPKWQYKVADWLPKAKVVEIAESGHAIPLDAPLQFSQALKQFLKAS